MKKFVLYIDYKKTGSYSYKTMKATNIVDAIIEADEAYDQDSIYLMRIMEKVGKTVKENDYKVEMYKAVMCKRSAWHKNDKENCESEHCARRCYNKYFEDISCVG